MSVPSILRQPALHSTVGMATTDRDTATAKKIVFLIELRSAVGSASVRQVLEDFLLLSGTAVKTSVVSADVCRPSFSEQSKTFAILASHSPIHTHIHKPPPAHSKVGG